MNAICTFYGESIPQPAQGFAKFRVSKSIIEAVELGVYMPNHPKLSEMRWNTQAEVDAVEAIYYKYNLK